MRSIKTHVTAAAVLTAGLVMLAPAAHATAAPKAVSSATCSAAIAAADKAEAAFKAASDDMKKQIAAGGHPGAAEQADLAALGNARDLATSDAARICGVTPVGPVRTGVGSTSRGTNATEIGAGLGLVAVAGAGAVALRRRRAGSEA